MERATMTAPEARPPWAGDMLCGGQAMNLRTHEIAHLLERMVLHPDYPCLGARSVFNRHRATILVLDELATRTSARALLDGMRDFAATTDLDDGFASFVAVYRHPPRVSEAQFERLLWRQLQLLNEADFQPWSPDVSADPASPHFSFSVAGTAYFVVGLHPDASRLARRAPLPTMVFNLHEQFRRLRDSDGFTRMQHLIRRRDSKLQGAVNPMLEDFGSASEARQYAGRVVSEDWAPPYEIAGPRPAALAD
jgi:uncharacterized protein